MAAKAHVVRHLSTTTELIRSTYSCGVQQQTVTDLQTTALKGK